MTDLKLVIMAAGMGSRFGSLKQMEGLGPSNEFLMDYAIFDAYKAGIRNICLVVRDSFLPQITDRMTSAWKSYSDLKFEFVCQELNDLPEGYKVPEERAKPWGTAHVLYVLRKAVRSPFLIINADDFYGRAGINTMIQFLKQNSDKHALVGYPLKNTLSPHGPVTRGVCEIENGQLVGIDEVEKIFFDDPRQVLASMNLWGFSPSIFNLIEKSFDSFLDKNIENPKAEYQIPQIINDLLKAKKVEVAALSADSPWFGVTYKEDKEAVQNKLNALIESNEYPKSLFTRVN